MKQNWIKEFDEKFAIVDDRGVIWGKGGIIQVLKGNETQLDQIKNFIQSQLNKRDKEWKSRIREDFIGKDYVFVKGEILPIIKGNKIPKGWKRCDGKGGRPDLRTPKNDIREFIVYQ